MQSENMIPSMQKPDFMRITNGPQAKPEFVKSKRPKRRLIKENSKMTES